MLNNFAKGNAKKNNAKAIAESITIAKFMVSFCLIFLLAIVNKTAASSIEKGCSMYVNLKSEFFIIKPIPLAFTILIKLEAKSNIAKPIKNCVWKKIIVNRVDFLNNLLILPE